MPRASMRSFHDPDASERERRTFFVHALSEKDKNCPCSSRAGRRPVRLCNVLRILAGPVYCERGTVLA
jgi:hypothetical protein